MNRRVRATILSVLLAAASGAGVANAHRDGLQWPQGVQHYDLAQRMYVNGVPMRIKGFTSDRDAEALARAFLGAMGTSATQKRMGFRHVLARADGESHVTVQIEPTAHGSKGWVNWSDLKDLAQHQQAFRGEREAWTRRLPAGSDLLQHTRSDDEAQQAVHLTIVSGHGEAHNSDAMLALMRADGFRLDRDIQGADAQPQARVLMFSAPRREAVVVIGRNARPDGRTSIVVNIVTHSETAP